jgi:hypothetical protein
MLSWTLWRALNRAPRHLPLYRRAYLQQQMPEASFSLRFPMSGLLRTLLLVIIPVCIILLGAPVLAILYTLSLSLTPLLLPLANTLYGLAHATSTSGHIARERDRQTYDVLCTVPGGSLGMHWSYCAGWLQAHVLYRYPLLVLLGIGLFASLFGLPARLLFDENSVPLAVTVARGLGLGIFFVLDYAQTLVIASLTALLVPASAENESSARLLGASLFLVLQAAVYLPIIFLNNVALPNALALLGMDATTIAVLVPLLSAAFFVVLREIMIFGLWQRTGQQLSATAVELDALRRAAV